jgi:hypothetical protein
MTISPPEFVIPHRLIRTVREVGADPLQVIHHLRDLAEEAGTADVPGE